MLADDEERQLPGDTPQETPEAEVAIGDPQGAFLDLVEDGVDQRPLLGMTVFAQDDVGHQLIGGLEDAKGLPRQGGGAAAPCLAEAVFGGGDSVAVEDVHVVAGDRPWQGATDLAEERLYLPSRVTDEFSGYFRLDALKFVVQGGERD
jgi:hypothetical protein